MNTLILYATKHGAAREIARRIANRLDDAEIHDLSQSGIPDLAEFDCVVVGSSVYVGMIRKEAKKYLRQNAESLKSKTLGLYVSCMDEGGKDTYFKSNFVPELLSAAKTTGILGGVFDPQKAGAIERFIIKVIKKSSAYIDLIDDAAIERFVNDLES